VSFRRIRPGTRGLTGYALGIIVAILLLNAVVGWYQEKQAADVVASLKGDIAMKARVVRNGAEQDIKARELVPGDIVSSNADSRAPGIG
jgi:H+-transporting ATPase